MSDPLVYSPGNPSGVEGEGDALGTIVSRSSGKESAIFPPRKEDRACESGEKPLPNFRQKMQFRCKIVKIYTLFSTNAAQKPYALAPQIHVYSI